MGEEWRITVTDHTGLMLFLMDFVVAEAAATGRISWRPNEGARG